jgi:hypothetical protein
MRKVTNNSATHNPSSEIHSRSEFAKYSLSLIVEDCVTFLHKPPTLISMFQCPVYNSPVMIAMLRQKHTVHIFNTKRVFGKYVGERKINDVENTTST